MKKLSFTLALLSIAALLGGCMTTPVSNSGGLTAVTIPNTNRSAIGGAAQDVFSQYGYSGGANGYSDQMAFDKPANKFGNLMWGSYGDTTTVRVIVTATRIPGSPNFRVSAKATVVNDAGTPGFEDSRRISPVFSLQFGSLLQKIKAEAANAGS